MHLPWGHKIHTGKEGTVVSGALLVLGNLAVRSQRRVWELHPWRVCFENRICNPDNCVGSDVVTTEKSFSRLLHSCQKQPRDRHPHLALSYLQVFY